MTAYDKNVDYSLLIAQEAAKGVNADKNLLAQYEAARNAKIAGEGLDYAQTNVYTREVTEPRHYYTATDQSDYIRDIYAEAQRQALAALEGAYTDELAAYDAEAAQLPGVYQAAKNRTAAAGEIAQQGMNERFAASGLNTGAQGQAALALGMTVQGGLASLESERAAKLSELGAQRAKVKSQYQQAVADAIAQNEIELARALYEEAVRVDNSYAVADAELLEEVYTTSQGHGYTGYTGSGYTGAGTASGTASGAAASAAEEPANSGTSVGAYEQALIKAAAKPTASAQLSSIQTAVSNGSISSAEAAKIRKELGLGTAAAQPVLTGGGGGRMVATTK